MAAPPTKPTLSSLERRFRIINIALFSLLAVVLTVSSYTIVRRITLTVGKTEAELHSTNAAARISGYIDRETILVAYLCQSPGVQEYFADEENEEKRKACFDVMQDTLKLLHANNFYTTIEKSKNEISFEQGQGLDKFAPFDKVVPGRMEDKWYFECIGQSHDYVLNVDVDKLLQRKLIWLNHKVFSRDQKLLGVLAIGLQLHQLLENLFHSYADREVRWFVIDGKGYIQMDSSLAPERRLVFDQYASEYHIGNMIDDPAFLSNLTPLLARSDVFKDEDLPTIVSLSTKIDGLPYDYAVIAPLKGTDWSVITCYNAETLFDVSFMYPLLCMLVGGVVLYVFITISLNRQLLFKPLRLLSMSVLKSVRDKNATLYGLDRTDEFGILADHIHQMRERLEQNSQQLYEAYHEVRCADYAKSQFLSVISHELRTPLNGVIGMAELLKMYPLESEQKEFVSIISESANSLLKLIEDVLEFADMDMGKTALHIEPFHWPDLITSVLSSVQPRVDHRDLQLIVTDKSYFPSRVYGDSQRIRQVLLSLLSNAVKFTHKGSIELKIETEPVPASQPDEQEQIRVCCTITDTGIGIEEQTLETLFQPFVQGDSSLTRSHEGVGIGLAICKRLTDLMNGSLTATSILNEGSQFKFEITLPLE